MLFDPYPDMPNHEIWERVFYVAANTMDSEIYKVFQKLRHEGIEVAKERKGKLFIYKIKAGSVGVERFRSEIIPQVLNPNAEKVRTVLSLCGFEPEFVTYEGIIFDGDKEVAASALKKYQDRILEARYNDWSVGVRMKDGRKVWVVCERAAGSDVTEITWEEFYLLVYLQEDLGKLEPGAEGLAKGVRWKE